MTHFEEDGLFFDCPEGWTLQRDEEANGWTVTLQSPGSAFAVVQLDRSMPAIEDMASVALENLRTDYPKLEATSALETLAGEMAVGHDIEFFDLDLPIICSTRAFYGPAGSVFVLSQWVEGSDADYEPALSALRASMRSESE